MQGPSGQRVAAGGSAALSTKTVRALIGAGLLVAAVWYIGGAAIAEELRHLQSGWLLAAVVAILASALLGALNSYLIVSVDLDIHFRQYLPLYWLSWAVGLLLPGQVGDLASITVALRRRGIDWQTVLGRALLDKLTSLGLITALGLIGLLSLYSRLPTLVLWILPIGAALIWGAWPLLARWQRLRMLLMHSRLLASLHRILREGYWVARHHPARLLANMVLTAVKFALVVLSYWCTFAALGHTAQSLAAMFPLTALSSLVAYIPISINGIGTAELTGIMLFGTLGVPQAAVLSGYLLLRIAGLGLAWGPSALWLLARAP